MQLLGNLFEYTLAKDGAALNILGATSGDTGSAAEYAMRGKRGIRVFMLSPHRKMSAFQTAQMFSLQDPNIFNIAVEGVFDDCQDIVKAVSNDLDYKAAQKIGTVNSINWARVVAQVVYYFRGYLSATTDNRQKVSFTVPSGNFGNICAGHIARMMGLPIDKLVAATNENDVLDEFFRTGVYRVRKSAETYHTSSPSMDISKASNFERFIFDLLGRDSRRVRALFDKVETAGGFDLSGRPGSDGDEFASVLQYGFGSGKSTHQDRLDTIRDVQDEYGITIDTHTADGIKVAREHMRPGVPMIVLETALAAKFNETILEALGTDAERPAGFEALETLPQRFEVMPADADRIKAFIAAHTGLPANA
jgi:threonine synthase